MPHHPEHLREAGFFSPACQPAQERTLESIIRPPSPMLFPRSISFFYQCGCDGYQLECDQQAPSLQPRGSKGCKCRPYYGILGEYLFPHPSPASLSIYVHGILYLGGENASEGKKKREWHFFLVHLNLLCAHSVQNTVHKFA